MKMSLEEEKKNKIDNFKFFWHFIFKGSTVSNSETQVLIEPSTFSKIKVVKGGFWIFDYVHFTDI